MQPDSLVRSLGLCTAVLVGCVAPTSMGPPPLHPRTDGASATGAITTSTQKGPDRTVLQARWAFESQSGTAALAGIAGFGLVWTSLVDDATGAIDHGLIPYGSFGGRIGPVLVRATAGLFGAGGGEAGFGYGHAGLQLAWQTERWQVYVGGHGTLGALLLWDALDNWALNGTVGVQWSFPAGRRVSWLLGAEATFGEHVLEGPDAPTALDPRFFVVGLHGGLDFRGV